MHWKGHLCFPDVALSFPLHLQKGRRKEQADILWVHHLFFTFLGWLKNRPGKDGSEAIFYVCECRRKICRKYWPSKQIHSPLSCAQEGHFPKYSQQTSARREIPQGIWGKKGNQEHCLELGELRGVCAKKHQYGQESSLRLLSSCL